MSGLPPHEHACAGSLRCLRKARDDVVLCLVLPRPEDVVPVQAAAHRHRGGDGGEFLADGVVDVVVDVESLECGAGLARVDEGAPEEVLGDGLGVGVGQYDAGVVSAQFQRGPFDGVCREDLMMARPATVELVNMISMVSGSRGMVAVARSQATQAPTSKRALGPFRGLPCSRESSWASSSAERSTASAAWRRALPTLVAPGGHGWLGGDGSGYNPLKVFEAMDRGSPTASPVAGLRMVRLCWLGATVMLASNES